MGRFRRKARNRFEHTLFGTISTMSISLVSFGVGDSAVDTKGTVFMESSCRLDKPLCLDFPVAQNGIKIKVQDALANMM